MSVCESLYVELGYIHSYIYIYIMRTWIPYIYIHICNVYTENLLHYTSVYLHLYLHVDRVVYWLVSN